MGYYFYIELKCSEKFNAMQVFAALLLSNNQIYECFDRHVWGFDGAVIWFRL